MGAFQVQVVARQETMVKPAAETPRGTLWNSNVDLIIPQIHTTSVYFYPSDGSRSFFDAAVLRDALARVLVPFYPMAGRLKRDEDGRIEINCNAAGVLFVEAEANASIQELGGFAPDPALQALVPKVVYTKDITAFPLLVLQVTYFQCGGVSLGVGMEHHIADGMSGIHFINSWSDFARGEGLKVEPFIDRTLLRARPTPSPMFPHVEYLTPPALKPEISIRRFDNGYSKQDKSYHTVVEIFPFTKEHLAKLKDKASDKATGTTYSSYVALSAHIWRSVTQARGLSGDQETKLFVATDGRSRLRPTLPRGYFGNVIFTSTPIALGEDISSEPLSFAAGKLHGAVQRMDNDYLRSALDFLDIQPDLSKLIRGAAHYGNPNLGITSWTGLPVYDCDFGWGRAVYMGPAHIGYEGLCFVLPSPTRDGSLTLALRLRDDHMAEFRKIVYAV
eukprot:TRINITY_DN5863_c0_g1_i1.p1 TRINITY_DN5863_c0_g1~~TRINITY_DN5863_c0_g1_i1.p1  ORF type:complete len:447 (-),score=56.01 TRINITY_DN5863_c0_g1_i1:356-1696(-)